MTKRIVVLIALILSVTLQLSAQQATYNQKKLSRDIEVSIGDMDVWLDYMPMVTSSLKESVLARMKQDIPLVVVPIKLINTNQNKMGDEASHKVKATVVLYEVGKGPRGGFEATFYLVHKESDSRHAGPELYMFYKDEYTGQARTAIQNNPDTWFLKPSVVPDMVIYAKISISIDGFETITFTTKPTKVGMTS